MATVLVAGEHVTARIERATMREHHRVAGLRIFETVAGATCASAAILADDQPQARSCSTWRRTGSAAT